MSKVSTSVFAHFEYENEVYVTTHMHDDDGFSIGVGDVTLFFASKADAMEVLNTLVLSAKFTGGIATYFSNKVKLEGKE